MNSNVGEALTVMSIYILVVAAAAVLYWLIQWSDARDFRKQIEEEPLLSKLEREYTADLELQILSEFSKEALTELADMALDEIEDATTHQEVAEIMQRYAVKQKATVDALRSFVND